MKYINLKGIKISRFILGGNPFSGFSHQSKEMDIKMKKYFTTERIKSTLKNAEKNGINTLSEATFYIKSSFGIQRGRWKNSMDCSDLSRN